MDQAESRIAMQDINKENNNIKKKKINQQSIFATSTKKNDPQDMETKEMHSPLIIINAA